ncbi:Coagulation factor VIII [Exaiptasia diaphana]|nr:Coagulation factor VIII [Exaiptasia diaphana]
MHKYFSRTVTDNPTITAATTAPPTAPPTATQKCDEPLGMKSKAIQDDRITASSSQSFFRYKPWSARLNLMATSGWIPLKARQGEWLQVDLGKPDRRVTGIATRGTTQYWTTGYSLQYSQDGKNFEDYNSGEVLKGNTDGVSVVKHVLKFYQSSAKDLAQNISSPTNRAIRLQIRQQKIFFCN